MDLECLCFRTYLQFVARCAMCLSIWGNGVALGCKHNSPGALGAAYGLRLEQGGGVAVVELSGF